MQNIKLWKNSYIAILQKIKLQKRYNNLDDKMIDLYETKTKLEELRTQVDKKIQDYNILFPPPHPT